MDDNEACIDGLTREIDERYKRIGELEEKIANYPYWGAVLTAWSEEIRRLEQGVKALEQERRKRIMFGGR